MTMYIYISVLTSAKLIGVGMSVVSITSQKFS